MGKYIYLAYSEEENWLKIGVSGNLALRYQHLKSIYGPLCILGYKFFKNSRDAFEMENTFKIVTKYGRSEWFPYCDKIIKKFKTMEGCIYMKQGIKKFPKIRYRSNMEFSKKSHVDKELQEKIISWRTKVGYKEALATFILAGISLSAAQKLLAGTYIPKPKQLLTEAILSAMKKSA